MFRENNSINRKCWSIKTFPIGGDPSIRFYSDVRALSAD